MVPEIRASTSEPGTHRPSAAYPADALAGIIGNELEVLVAVPQLRIDGLRGRGSEEVNG
jgi:hypothetical protein